MVVQGGDRRSGEKMVVSVCVCVWGGVVGKGRDVGRGGGIWYIGGGGGGDVGGDGSFEWGGGYGRCMVTWFVQSWTLWECFPRCPFQGLESGICGQSLDLQMDFGEYKTWRPSYGDQWKTEDVFNSKLLLDLLKHVTECIVYMFRAMTL